jgi:hypothetical protein
MTSCIGVELYTQKERHAFVTIVTDCNELFQIVIVYNS